MLAVKNIVLGLEELDSKILLLLVGRCIKKCAGKKGHVAQVIRTICC